MNQNEEQTTECPHCCCTHLYILGDGRHKCGACQKKFSAPGRRSRLAPADLDEIVKGFVAGSPALSVSTAAGINPKTVQCYYGRIRELVAKDREEYLASRYGAATAAPSVFAEAAAGTGWRNSLPIACAVAAGSEVELLFVSDNGDAATARPEPSSIAGWLVAADRRTMEGLQLEKINCLAPAGAGGERARNFWIRAKRRLAAYHGGFRQHFHLYLREVEFRENMESLPAVREHIEALLGRNTINVTGESDA
jgi:transposase